MDSIDFMDISDSAPKRRRVTSSTSSATENLKYIVNEMKDTQSRKFELLEKIVDTPEKSELELFFASICMTVQKLTPLEQARTKMDILQIVNRAEIRHIESCEYVYIVDDSKKFNSTPKNSKAIEIEKMNIVFEDEQEDEDETLDLR